MRRLRADLKRLMYKRIFFPPLRWWEVPLERAYRILHARRARKYRRNAS
jgi:hypothetical protein